MNNVLVSAATAARLADHTAIRTANGAYIHQIYFGKGSLQGQTNCGLKNGRSSRRARVNLAEVHVEKLCEKCWNVEAIRAESAA